MSTFIELLHAHKNELERHLLSPKVNTQVSLDIRKAVSAMLRCKTEQQGRSQWFCSNCHYDDRLPLSCGHRHCPQCQHRTTCDWLLRQKQKLLPTHYFITTFTLPYQLRILAKKQPKALYQVMFSVVASVLKSFAQKEQKGTLGFTAVLHTHSRRRDLHPHIHVISAGGRYDSSKQVWHKGNKRYLFNEFALAKVWRARLLEAINQHPQLWLPKSIPKQWVVDCQSVGYGEPALEYLSRYLYRGVLPDSDIIHSDDHSVTFRYKESKTNVIKTRSLPTLEFLLLILQHVLPKGLQRVRDYGFLRGQSRALLVRIQLLMLGVFYQTPPSIIPIRAKAIRICPHCQHDMECVGITRPR